MVGRRTCCTAKGLIEASLISTPRFRRTSSLPTGSIGMEGNGPLHGSPRNLGRIVLADDPVAADFVCTRLMGLNPLRVNYLAQAAEFLGNGTPDRIVQLGEPLSAPQQPLASCREFATCAFRFATEIPRIVASTFNSWFRVWLTARKAGTQLPLFWAALANG